MYQKRDIRVACKVILWLFIIQICYLFTNSESLVEAGFGALQPMIYFGLFWAWGCSIQKRIIHKKLKTYMLLIVSMVIFWFFVRSVKWYITLSEQTMLNRYLWYSYYIPMLFVPFLFLIIAFYMAKPENFRLPKGAAAVFFITLGLVMLVLTNDLHQMVFVFPDKGEWIDRSYRYGTGYWMIVGWNIILVLAGLGLLLKKCRISNNRRIQMLPLIPVLTGVIYTFLYAAGIPLGKFVFKDVTGFLCLCFVAALEGCVRCRLIASNMNYEEMFRISSVSMYLANEKNEICMASKAAEGLSKEEMEAAKKEPFLKEERFSVSAYGMNGGTVFWQEDVSEILKLLQELEDIREQLNENYELLRQEYLLESKKQHLEERNRLYDCIQSQLQRQIVLLMEYIDLFEQEDEQIKRKLLRKMMVVGTYLKRRSNLILIGAENGRISPAEVRLCFREYLDNLALYGTDTGMNMEWKDSVSEKIVFCFYDFMERIVEENMEELLTLMLHLREKDDTVQMLLNVETSSGKCCVSESGKEWGAEVRQEQDEDGTWQFRLCMGKEEAG